MPSAPDLAACLAHLAPLHPRLCPRQVLGVRMGLYAGALLGLDLPRCDKRAVVLVETDGCFADGVSVATGCWLGRRTLRLVDYGKVAITLADTCTGQSIRTWPHPLARARALAYAPTARDRWHAQLAAYQVMPTEELLRAESVHLPIAPKDALGRAGVRVVCDLCGEEILNDRDLATARGSVCRGCGGATYYHRKRPSSMDDCTKPAPT